VSWRRIGLAMEAQRPVAELRAAFARSEAIALDLDECLFPGYTQVALGRRVAWRILRRPVRRLLARLALGGVYFGIKETKRLVGVGTPMRRLVRRYERVLRLLEAAAEIPAASYPYAAETVAELATQAPTGLVSLGLDIVARAYIQAFRRAAGPSLSFIESNVVRLRPGCCGRVFDGYGREAFLENGADKRRVLEHRMAGLGAAVVTVVGHNEDDIAMAALARETGGLAVGFNSSWRLRDAFDIVVRGRDWEPMYAVAAILLGPFGR